MIQSKKKTEYINMKDVIIDILDHKVKLFHIPTKTIVESDKHKYLHKNKVEALSTLRKVLLEKSAS